MIKILLADDHNVLRQGIAQLLDAQSDIQVVGEAQNGEEVIALAREVHPDIIILDIEMPKVNGIEAARRIRQLDPQARIIILTMYKDDKYVLEGIRAGISGYLPKEIEMNELLLAVRRIAKGEAVIDPGVAAGVFKEIRGEKEVLPDTIKHLSTKDLHILRFLAEGHTNTEIAQNLELSEKTVRNRISLLLGRLKLKNRTEAALFAIQHGLGGNPDIQ